MAKPFSSTDGGGSALVAPIFVVDIQPSILRLYVHAAPCGMSTIQPIFHSILIISEGQRVMHHELYIKTIRTPELPLRCADYNGIGTVPRGLS